MADDDGRLVTDSVLAAHPWPTNGHLIADVARLGYLRATDHVLDPTYGKGTWWQQWRPENLTASDLDPAKSPTGQPVDFTDLPHPADTFDAAVFDPPYIAQGGRATSTLPEFLDRFGLVDVPRTCAGVQDLINSGLGELARVVRPRGVVAVKCMDYVSGGAMWPGTHHTVAHALELGMTYVDRLEHLGRPGPQPSVNPDGTPRRQLHARRNLSTLLVFRASAVPSAQQTLDLGAA